MTPLLEKAIERAKKEYDRLVAMGAAQDNPDHRHSFFEIDKSRHCFRCGITQHEPYPEALRK